MTPTTSPEMLLQAIDEIEPSRLKPFLSQILARAARRIAPSLTPKETELLRKINRGLPPQLDQRCRELVAMRRAGTLKTSDREELLSLTDQVEKLQAERVGHLVELAELRGTTLSTLMDELGLKPPPVE